MTYPGDQPPHPGTPPRQQPAAAHPFGDHGGLDGPVKGRDLLRSCWSLLKSDRELLLLPVMAAVGGAIAMAIFFVPGVLVMVSHGSEGAAKGWIYAGAIIGGFVASAIAIFFQAALVFGANERADGGDPTVGSTVRAAWGKIGKILGWAALTTVVGSLIRAVQERAGFLGGLIGFLGGVAWSIATFLAVPVVVAENAGPVEAVKRSSALIRQTWGLGLRSTLRWGLIQLAFMVVPVLALFGGFALISRGGAAVGLGIALTALALVALVVLSIAFAAVGQYARAMLYRYATGRPVPGLDPRLLAGAFAPKKDKGRFA
ncbi:DUF6159 family protein [Nakamurella deserti]|uniref:DUF6159 family protein n=1 Tax=Nakamurella deserti TaxID=2164074 RepID=UPI000DBE6C1B|nr:DUF6159 family protein [Nakamurella deserti]